MEKAASHCETRRGSESSENFPAAKYRRQNDFICFFICFLHVPCRLYEKEASGLISKRTSSFPSSRIMKIFHLCCSSLLLARISSALSFNDISTTRREFWDRLSRTTAIVGTAGVFGVALPVTAQADEGSSTAPFCVIGANGRTGSQCVRGCLERNLPVRVTSRSGLYGGPVRDDAQRSLMTTMVCDVTDPTTIANAVQGSRAVIFAASASKNGGTPSQVDNQGLIDVAKACIAAKVPHLVIVSSGSVTRPDSPVFKFLNLFGRIMEEKIKGEDAVRDLYRNVEGCTYTVVRPGGLTEDPPRGVAALELNQGDTKSGRISRADVASICIEATFYPNFTAARTFECYDADTGKPLESVGMSNIMKQKSDPAAYVTGRECRGNTWQELFAGLESDYA